MVQVATKATAIAAGTNANDDADDARSILGDNRSNEIWLGVVGPVGAGGSRAINALKKCLRSREIQMSRH